ncbi:hypothetical protein O9G_003035 [Rozella allomycis CSF55]|uniref:Uncharacterized protein n=1 Tax=Rozella allomycis (strain CSF55) TaxID=988480 RepID=A0A075B332_ROZAC|nr:hypothetical protein O9G_003035 [Rozella allomycis CSF55]|eukprot:EPZ35381.1 hypothetical protein O9G_003035 [Rozella allomycis CSF55]
MDELSHLASLPLEEQKKLPREKQLLLWKYQKNKTALKEVTNVNKPAQKSLDQFVAKRIKIIEFRKEINRSAQDAENEIKEYLSALSDVLKSDDKYSNVIISIKKSIESLQNIFERYHSIHLHANELQSALAYTLQENEELHNEIESLKNCSKTTNESECQTEQDWSLKIAHSMEFANRIMHEQMIRQSQGFIKKENEIMEKSEISESVYKDKIANLETEIEDLKKLAASTLEASKLELEDYKRKLVLAEFKINELETRVYGSDYEEEESEEESEEQ